MKLMGNFAYDKVISFSISEMKDQTLVLFPTLLRIYSIFIQAADYFYFRFLDVFNKKGSSC